MLNCVPASLDGTMRTPLLRTAFGHVELRPVPPRPDTPDGMRVYVLLPELDELLGAPGFGLRDPIVVGDRAAIDFFRLH
jgi:hypothetical protein